MTGVSPHHSPAPTATAAVTTSHTMPRAAPPGARNATSAPSPTARTPTTEQ
ncbi:MULTISPECIES: hypothetical protein [Streptomyces]|uniref:Uncharacterized protein n=1 Tax=Streptomyces lienomycini TaxID=284035 RepID=A0ABV9X1W5_9ACTN|nr:MULTISPECIES: hypothetical protein [Streptomyces]